MSTPAIWLFVALGVLLVAMVVVVALSVRSLARKAGTLSTELNDLSGQLDTVVGSLSTPSPDTPVHGDGGVESRTTYSGYHRRDVTRQEEVDHG